MPTPISRRETSRRSSSSATCRDRRGRNPLNLPSLYPITDRALAGGLSHAEIVKRLREGGATLVQIREKGMPDRLVAEVVRECLEVSGLSVIVNDRPDIASVTGAAGVHLGEDDLPAVAARELLGPGAILGVSTHSVEAAVAACALPVDYVAIGPVFDTPNASVKRKGLGLAAVAAAARRCRLPLVAIGGITLDSAPDVLAAGALSVAVISDLMRAEDIAARTRAYLALAPSAFSHRRWS